MSREVGLSRAAFSFRSSDWSPGCGPSSGGREAQLFRLAATSHLSLSTVTVRLVCFRKCPKCEIHTGFENGVWKKKIKHLVNNLKVLIRY